MNREKMTDVKVNRKIVYYIREELPRISDEDGSITYYKVPRTTVTLLEDTDGVLARGVAMCSPLDIFNKKQGRAISFNRALAAFDAKKNIGPIHRDEVFAEDLMLYKIQYKPELTEYEKKLLKGPKEV